MDQLQKHSMLSPKLSSKNPLTQLLNNLVPKTNHQFQAPFWKSEHYNLNSSKLFNNLKEEQQSEVILRLNQWSLELIYFIEKFGLNYGAKMILHAESEQEKSLYSLFAGDEVRHRLMIEPFLINGYPEDTSIHPLLKSLGLCLEEGTKEAMTFTIQVILEGFGLMHYTSLMNSCQDKNLTNVFKNILADEVNHHGMGVILTKKSQLNNQDLSQIVELTSMFVRSLLDANWVEKSLELTIGSLTKNQKLNFKQDISWEQSKQFKIKKLSELILKVGQKDIYERLETNGVFCC